MSRKRAGRGRCKCKNPQWTDWGLFSVRGVSRLCLSCEGLQFYRPYGESK